MLARGGLCTRKCEKKYSRQIWRKARGRYLCLYPGGAATRESRVQRDGCSNNKELMSNDETN